MSVLNLDVLDSAQNRVYPDDQTVAQIQVILEHPQLVDALNQAVEKTIALRKAHLDEIASTVSLPVDDTTDLSVEIRRIITYPLYGWAESSRRFVSRLLVANAAVTVTAPAFSSNIAVLDRILQAYVTLGAGWWPVTYSKMSDGWPLFPWATTKGSKPNSSNSSTQWGTAVNQFTTGYGQLTSSVTNITDTDNGYNGIKANPSTFDPSNTTEALGAIMGTLEMIIQEYVTAGSGVSPYTGSTVTLPSMIADMVAYYYTIFKFLRTEIATYCGNSYKFIADADFTTLQAAYTAL
jgi:hypothetical protein